MAVTLPDCCHRISALVDRMEYEGVNTKRFSAISGPENLKKQPAAYKFLILFIILASLSTILSDYKFESFWGNEGRFSGLFLYLPVCVKRLYDWQVWENQNGIWIFFFWQESRVPVRYHRLFLRWMS